VIKSVVTGNGTTIEKTLAGDERFVTVPPALMGKPKSSNCGALADDAQTLIRNAFTNVTPERGDVG
jgi:hypothetical protein